MKKNILITGGAGNLGGSLTRKLVEDKNNFVVVMDNLLTGDIAKLPTNKTENFIFYESDVNSYNELSKIFKEYHFDLVFHYAAIVGVERTLKNPLMVLDDIEGMKNILQLSMENNISRFFYSSSSEVYGEPVEIPQNEVSTPLNSRLPYAVVKNLGELYCKSYKQMFDLDYTIMRFFNTYGPLQSEDFVMAKFLNQAIKNDDITINGDGLQTRTFLYVDDNVDLIIKLIDESKCLNEIINVGSDEEITIIDLAKIIIKLTGSTSKIIHLPPLEEGDMTRRKPDILKMNSILNKEIINLESGIKKYLNYL